MKLSTSVYNLKRRAKILSRHKNIPLHAALDDIAAQEGFSRWSLLAAKASQSSPARKLYNGLIPGDLLLLAARPGQGKTLLGLELAVEALKSRNPAFFFSLDYTERDMDDAFLDIGATRKDYGAIFQSDFSDAISAAYVMEKMASAPRGTLAVIDYLQLLDQKRANPVIAEQVSALRSFARDRGIAFVFISQIDRSYDPSSKPCPDMGDIRLPNPLDMKLFSKTCFLHGGEIRFGAAA